MYKYFIEKTYLWEDNSYDTPGGYNDQYYSVLRHSVDVIDMASTMATNPKVLKLDKRLCY